jgi:hypothetical protein
MKDTLFYLGLNNTISIERTNASLEAYLKEDENAAQTVQIVVEYGFLRFICMSLRAALFWGEIGMEVFQRSD